MRRDSASINLPDKAEKTVLFYRKNVRRRAEKPQNSEEWIKTIGVKKPPIPALAQRTQADKYSLAPDCEKSSCRNDLSEDRFCSCLSDLCIFKWLIHPRVVLSAYNKWREASDDIRLHRFPSASFQELETNALRASSVVRLQPTITRLCPL